MIEITNPEIFGKTIAEALVKIEKNRSLTTPFKLRWINAVAKAVHLIEDQPEFLEFHAELDMLTVWNYETNMVYNANGKCECESARRGQPCKHQAAKRLIKNYLAAEAAAVLAEVESENKAWHYVNELFISPEAVGCGCVYDWDSKFTEKYCDEHGAEAAEIEAERDYHESTFDIHSFDDAPYLKPSTGTKSEKIGNIRI